MSAKNLVVVYQRDGGMAAAQINSDGRLSHSKNESFRTTKQRNTIRFEHIMIKSLFFLFAFERLYH